MAPTAHPFRPKQLLHGADYNPEQWRHVPGVWEEDLRLLREARMNCVSIGIFSWAELEPEEGVFRFDWMDEIIERLHANGTRIILATPSGAKPNWLAAAYPEVRRVTADGRRELQRGRHNHCLTSPVYRQKVRIINGKLAERYGKHPAVVAWHISNEYSGFCHCDLCKQGFREWLRRRHGSLEALNNAWWTRFWSHTYTDWTQIDAIDESVHGLRLDWFRYTTDQVASFIRNEVEPLRAAGSTLPTTINLMLYTEYDYNVLMREVDFASWDSYPEWHTFGGDGAPHWKLGVWTTFFHDLFRCTKRGEPMLLMESTPSQVNWKDISPLKRPGMHRSGSLLAVSRGSEGVCYFQFRASRGSAEKFHGSVVSHDGRDDTRVFRDVRALGEELQRLTPLLGSLPRPQVALLHCYENGWAIREMQSPVRKELRYHETCVAHQEPFWARGVGVDVVDQVLSLDGYRIVVAPMLHLLRPGTAERLAAFVEAGGTLVTTYLTGYVDQNDLCHLGGFPGPLRPLLGVRAEEIDALPAFRTTAVSARPGNSLGLAGEWRASGICEVLHAEDAEVLATYGSEFYAGTPVVTRRRHGKGVAYHVGARIGGDFLQRLTDALLAEAGVAPTLAAATSAGITAQERTHADGRRWLFVMNFAETEGTAALAAAGGAWKDAETGSAVAGSFTLPPFGLRLLASA